MARLLLAWIAGIVVATLGAGCHGDPVKCETGCRNYYTLQFWDEQDKAIASAPPLERDALRKQKQDELKAQLAKGVDLCVSKCVSANDDKDLDCMVEAKTAADAKACVSD